MARKFHLVVDFSHLLPGGANGGVKPFFFELLSWLSRQDEFPLRITYLTHSASHQDVRALATEDSTLVCVRHDAAHPLGALFARNDSERSIKSVPAGYIHSIQADALYCPFGPIEFASPGIPTISFVADLLHRDYPFSLPDEEIAHRERVFASIAEFSDLIQCNSKHVMERMSVEYGVAAERMFYTYNAIHKRLPLVSRLDAPLSAVPYFLYPANTWAHKNHETLLAAFCKYCIEAGSSAWDLALTGHEDIRMQELRGLAKALGIGNKVQFLGHVPNSQFAKVWSGAGALVFPSLHEGFGIPPLEAMHFGVPIICSGEGSLPEVVADAALIVDCRSPEELATAMAQVASSGELRGEIVAKGRKRLTMFALENEARKLLGAIQATQSVRPRLSHQGIFIDGWTGPRAFFAMPSDGKLWRISISCRPIPVNRRLRVYRGAFPFGGYSVEKAKVTEVSIDMIADGSPLVLEVPDAGAIAAPDERILGVHVEKISAICQGEDTQTLWPPLS